MSATSYLGSAHPEFIEETYRKYIEDPESIDPSWRYFFDGLELGAELPIDRSTNGDAPLSHASTGSLPAHDNAAKSEAATQMGLDINAEAKVADLINGYRERGHLIANLNPLGPAPDGHPLLDLKNFGLMDRHMDRVFSAGNLIGIGPSPLRDILRRLKKTYCGSIGVEFTHIKDPETREWVRSRIEAFAASETLAPDAKKKILHRLCESETFERFLHTRYVAQKRFSVEGAETVIPILDRIVDTAAELGANDIVMGMAHRGRLNVLRHIFGKKAEFILTEFEQEYQYDSDSMGEGDVKYHMGYSADIETPSGRRMHLSLANNPSHLAFIHPVVEGVARAKQRWQGDKERKKVVPVIIHGDAAFAGQGVVYETLNLSQVKGYCTGGTVHVIINNQVGFTTNPQDARSTTYCTDVARMLEVPIFHVNGDDPEAASYVARLSMEFRQQFGKDVVIDLICYRKYGHNEGDEPAFTQPIMYKQIKAHASTREVYAQKLIDEGLVSAEEAQADVLGVTQELTDAQTRTRAEKPKPYVSAYQSALWKKYRRPSDDDLFSPVATGFDAPLLRALAETINAFPPSVKVNPKLQRLFEGRLKAVRDGQGLDWGNAETLAYATLLSEGYSIRLSGQDVERGTFSHRNAVVFDGDSGEPYAPLSHIKPQQGEFIINNSTLSETGVLGFEYGWSLGDPNALVIWEAQFGDFANGAQVIIDQFIASGESKWQRASGIVLYLPHGYEGQGPEHSSARLERFLQLCGRANMTVANLSTPAQLFHALRRQLKRDFRKPLVLMTPKSLLRHPQVISSVDELANGSFQEVLDDVAFADAAKAASARKVLLCCGKIYWDLNAMIAEKKIQDVALIRIEQLYPWPEQKIVDVLSRYSGVREFSWVQEEPRNMGAWQFVFSFWAGGLREMSERLGKRPMTYYGRGTGAAPAVGSAKLHNKDQMEIILNALS
jgi:2-oxoglutarate dehydrogenase E1 component